MKKSWSSFIPLLRSGRILHKWTAIVLSVFILVSALTGWALAWKKQVDWLQPGTKKGISKDLSSWLPVEELSTKALAAFAKAHPEIATPSIERLDIRPDKGVVKVLFEQGWWELQMDGTTAEVYGIQRRHADWIEQLHDGSIINEATKLFTMNSLGLGLLMLLTTGLWLWYGPIKIRKLKLEETTNISNVPSSHHD